MTLPRLLQRVVTLLVACLILSAPALATWSIVVINKKTGEVCVASATCLDGNFALKRWLPVIVVDRGAAAAQSAIDSSGVNRKRIWDGIHAGLLPERILDRLASTDGNHQARQYGIVSFDGAPVTFTGSGAGNAKHGVVGEVGDLVYAIQGNVLAGNAVIDQAELALANTPGDLGQRVMAAMEAARALGGDGRCSCSQADPDGCGTPPPGSWKSAHTTFIVLARRGDKDGPCNLQKGCASGGYYMALVVKGVASDPDPVLELQLKYDLWRADLIDVADQVHSLAVIDRDALVADGLASATVRVQLRDVNDLPLSAGGHKLQVRWTGEGAPTAVPGPVTDLGGGAYSFALTATDVVGRGSWVVRSKRPGEKWVQLAQPLALPTEELIELHAGRDAVQAGSVPFTLNRGAGDAGSGYLLLGSAAGTTPGVPFQNVVIPLNRDRLFEWAWGVPGQAFQGSAGVLDAQGRAEALLELPPGGWGPLVGAKLSFCALIGGPPYAVTNVETVEVLP